MAIASAAPATAKLRTLQKRLADDISGASIIEYGMILALVAVLAIASLNIIGSHTQSTLSSAASFLP